MLLVSSNCEKKIQRKLSNWCPLSRLTHGSHRGKITPNMTIYSQPHYWWSKSVGKRTNQVSIMPSRTERWFLANTISLIYFAFQQLAVNRKWINDSWDMNHLPLVKSSRENTFCFICFAFNFFSWLFFLFAIESLLVHFLSESNFMSSSVLLFPRHIMLYLCATSIEESQALLARVVNWNWK